MKKPYGWRDILTVGNHADAVNMRRIWAASGLGGRYIEAVVFFSFFLECCSAKYADVPIVNLTIAHKIDTYLGVIPNSKNRQYL